MLPNHPDETADFLEIREMARKLCEGFFDPYRRGGDIALPAPAPIINGVVRARKVAPRLASHTASVLAPMSGHGPERE
jgi:hypothetical protein